MDVEDDQPPSAELEPREPTVEDLANLCRELNRRQARYVVIGGFAMRALGYVRQTMDLDFIVAADPDNEARVFDAVATLPDHAACQLRPGELDQFTVLRVGDEFVVDLMKSAGGVDYAQAAKSVVVHEVAGVAIPFASPQLLWRLKSVTHRAKDAPDLLYLRHWFQSRGEEPPGA